jgi:hypothetical protein
MLASIASFQRIALLLYAYMGLRFDLPCFLRHHNLSYLLVLLFFFHLAAALPTTHKQSININTVTVISLSLSPLYPYPELGTDHELPRHAYCDAYNLSRFFLSRPESKCVRFPSLLAKEVALAPHNPPLPPFAPDGFREPPFRLLASNRDTWLCLMHFAKTLLF